MMARWLSARDVAEAQLPGVASTRENAGRFIARVAVENPDLVRPRVGRGGGLEVSETALPPQARAALRASAVVDHPAAAAFAEVEAIEADRRQMLVRGSAHLTPRQRMVMEARQTLLLAIDADAAARGVGRDRAIRDFVARAAQGLLEREQVGVVIAANDRRREATVSHRTLWRWFAARDGGRGAIGAGIIALAPDHDGSARRAQRRPPPWLDDFLKHYRKPQKVSVPEALRAWAKEASAGTAFPTEKQVHAALKALPLIVRRAGREGKLALRARQAFAARDFSDIAVTSIYVGDGKTFAAEIAHPIHGQPFRPELSTFVDVATRKIVGWSAALDENTHGVVDALRRACADCGVPAIVYTDRGPGYRNKAMDDPLTGFLARASITPMRALPRNAQAKGVVERLNQLYDAAAKRLPTYLGDDMDREARQLVFKRSRRELAVTGASRLLPGWDAFLDFIEETVRDYNNRPHSSLPKFRDAQLCRNRCMTPNEMWAQKGEGFDFVVPDAAELDDMFRPYVVRRTRRALVDWLGNSYFAPALEAYDGQDVVVGYDIRDASRVWVREIDDTGDGRGLGRLIAIAAFEGHKTRYVPLSAERAAMEKRSKGRLARLQSKIGVVEQELRPHALLEQAPPTPPAPVAFNLSDILPAPAGGEAGSGVASPRTGSTALAGDRPIFRDNASLCRWLIAHPERVDEDDRDVLRDLLTMHSSAEALRMAGLDLDALRKLVRSNGAPEAKQGQDT